MVEAGDRQSRPLIKVSLSKTVNVLHRMRRVKQKQGSGRTMMLEHHQGSTGDCRCQAKSVKNE